MNNVLSLVKNVFYKLKNPLKILYYCFLAFLVVAIVYVLFFHDGIFSRRFMLATAMLIIAPIPLWLKLVNKLLTASLKPLLDDNKRCFNLFILSSIVLCLLSGAIIPLGVIGSSVVEFSYIDDIACPLSYFATTVSQSLGLFILWPLCIYLMFGKRIKTILTTILLLLSASSLICCFIFPGDYGTLTRMLNFSDAIRTPGVIWVLVNIITCILVALGIVLLIARKKLGILSGIYSSILIAFLAMGAGYVIKINKDYKAINPDIMVRSDTIDPVIHLSPTGHNVVLLMLDRAESLFFSLLQDTNPELLNSFEGFTYYPNTVAFGGHTIIGAPPIFGGYEYTPLEMNRRGNIPQVQKHNEALLVLPRIFSEKLGYSATVADSSWANYSWIPDMSIYNKYPNITALTLSDKYTSIWQDRNKDKVEAGTVSRAIKRNMLYLSIFRSSPYILRDIVYDDGLWWNPNEVESDILEFIKYYSTLCYLDELTDFSATGNTYTSITNETTHKSAMLEPPEYEPRSIGSAVKLDLYAGSWCTFMAAMIKVTRWFNYLKSQGVYDNTRIIIVADHGIGYKIDPLDNGYPRDHLHPLLLVKDFDSNGTLSVNNDFMTTADVPTIALKGLDDNPTNPFTSRPLTYNKTQGEAIVTTNGNWSPGQHNVNSFKLPRKEWMVIRGNYFDKDAWKEYTGELP